MYTSRTFALTKKRENCVCIYRATNRFFFVRLTVSLYYTHFEKRGYVHIHNYSLPDIECVWDNILNKGGPRELQYIIKTKPIFYLHAVNSRCGGLGRWVRLLWTEEVEFFYYLHS